MRPPGSDPSRSARVAGQPPGSCSPWLRRLALLVLFRGSRADRLLGGCWPSVIRWVAAGSAGVVLLVSTARSWLAAVGLADQGNSRTGWTADAWRRRRQPCTFRGAEGYGGLVAPVRTPEGASMSARGRSSLSELRGVKRSGRGPLCQCPECCSWNALVVDGVGCRARGWRRDGIG